MNGSQNLSKACAITMKIRGLGPLKTIWKILNSRKRLCWKAHLKVEHFKIGMVEFHILTK